MLKRLQSAYASAQAMSTTHKEHKVSTPSVGVVDWEQEIKMQHALRKLALHQAVLQTSAAVRHRRAQQDRHYAKEGFGKPVARGVEANVAQPGCLIPESCMRPARVQVTVSEERVSEATVSPCSEAGSTCTHVSHSDSDSDSPRHFLSHFDAVVAKQPANGSCLFHSLSYGLNTGKSARELRREICKFLMHNADMEIAGVPLKEWVKLESGKSLSRYVSSLARGAWGGAIELEAFVKLYPVDVCIFVRCPGGYQKNLPLQGRIGNGEDHHGAL